MSSSSSSSQRNELFLPPVDTLVLSDFPNLSELVVPDDFLSNDIENLGDDTTMLHDLDPKVDLKTLAMPEINDFCIALEASIERVVDLVAEEDRGEGGGCSSTGNDMGFDGFKLDSIADFTSREGTSILQATHEYIDDGSRPLMGDIIMSSAAAAAAQQHQQQEKEEEEEEEADLKEGEERLIGNSSSCIVATTTSPDDDDDDPATSLSLDEETTRSSSSSSSSCLVLPPINLEPTNIPQSSLFHIDSPLSSPTLAAASSASASASAAFGTTKHKSSSLQILHNHILGHDADADADDDEKMAAAANIHLLITDSSSNLTFSSSCSSVPSPRGDACQSLPTHPTNEAQQDHPSTMIRSQSSHSLGQLRLNSAGNLMSPCPENSTFSHQLELRIPTSFSSLAPFPYYQASSPVFVEGAPVRRVFSTGDLQALNGMHMCCYGNTNACHMEHPNNEEALGLKIGHYTVEERKERLHRYRQKRNERNFSKKIKYACRKTLADSRPRVRGRFARTLDDAGETFGRENGDEDHHKEGYGTRMNLSGKCSMVKEPGAPRWKPLRMNFAMGHGV